MIMKQLNNPIHCNSAVLHNGNTTELKATELWEKISVHLLIVYIYCCATGIVHIFNVKLPR